MSRTDIRAGGGYVELSTRDAKFYAGLKRSLGAASKWAGSIGKISAGGAAGFLAGSIGIQGGLQAISSVVSGFSILGFAKGFADAGSRIDDMSQRTGIAAEQLSTLDYVARLNDASLEDVGIAVKGMSGFLFAAANGSADAMESIAGLGLSLQQLGRADQYTRFRLLASAIGEIADPAIRAATAMKVFGKGGQALLPMIGAGTAAFDELAAKAAELGLVMSGPDAKAAAALGDSFDDLSMVAGGLGKKIGSALTPQVTKILGTAIKILTPLGRWIEANRELIGTIVPIAAAGLAAATGLALVAGGVSLLAPLLPIAFKIGLALFAVAGVARIVYRNFGLLASIAGSAFNFVSSAAATLAGSLGDNFRSFLNWAVGGFRSFASGAIDNLSAIATAVANGELGAAFDLVLATFDLAWDSTIATFQAGWGELTNNMALLGIEAAYGFWIAWENAFSGIRTLGIDVGASLRKAWFGLQYELAGLAEFTGIASEGSQARMAQDLIDQDNAATSEETTRKTAIETSRKTAVENLQENRELDRGNNAAEGQRRGDAAAERVSKAMEGYNKALAAAKASKGKSGEAKPEGVGPLSLSMPGPEYFQGFGGEGQATRAENVGTFSGFGAAVGSTAKYDSEQVKKLGMIHDTLREIALRNLGIA